MLVSLQMKQINGLQIFGNITFTNSMQEGDTEGGVAQPFAHRNNIFHKNINFVIFFKMQ